MFCVHIYAVIKVRLQLHGAIYRPDFFVSNLKAIRYESTSLNRIVAGKLHRVIVALHVSRNSAFTFD